VSLRDLERALLKVSTSKLTRLLPRSLSFPVEPHHLNLEIHPPSRTTTLNVEPASIREREKLLEARPLRRTTTTRTERRGRSSTRAGTTRATRMST